MSNSYRIPEGIEVDIPHDLEGHIFWMGDIGPDWEAAKAELTAAFEGARQAAIGEKSMVFVVENDDLLGRKGPTRAMVAAGLVSAARTAALEGVKKGWTANVVAYDTAIDPRSVMERVSFVLKNGLTTGEVIHMGPGHIGKALV